MTISLASALVVPYIKGMTHLATKPVKRPTRKHKLCFSADYRGYTHACSRLTWSERRDGPAGATLMCADPYVVGNRNATVACIPTR
jgi:hypothetical protein